MTGARRWIDELPAETFSVRCGGVLHHVTWQPRHRLTFHDHADLEADRALMALGGDGVGCADLDDAVAWFRCPNRILELWRPLDRNHGAWRFAALKETPHGVIAPTFEELREAIYALQASLKRSPNVAPVGGPPGIARRLQHEVDEMTRLIALPVGMLDRLAIDRLQDAMADARHPERDMVPRVAEVWGMEGLRRTVPMAAADVEPDERNLHVCFAAHDVADLVGHVAETAAHAALWVGEQWLRDVVARGMVVVDGRLVLAVADTAAGGAIVKAVAWRRIRGTPAGTLEPAVVEAHVRRGDDGTWRVAAGG